MWVNEMENDGEADSALLISKQITQQTYPWIQDGIGELQVEKTLLDCFTNQAPWQGLSLYLLIKQSG